MGGENSRPLRRLTRTQIQEILERNAALYREEPHFTTYIVDLALYLLEYEYDWANAGIEPPVAQPKAATDPGTHDTGSHTGGVTTSSGRQYTPQPTPRETPPVENAKTGTVVNLTPPALRARRPPSPTPTPVPASSNPANVSFVQPNTPLGSIRPAAYRAPTAEAKACALPAGADARPVPATSGRRIVTANLRQTTGQRRAAAGDDCPYCGTPLDTAKTCPRCKNMVG
jgi:hypothetical protein